MFLRFNALLAAGLPTGAKDFGILFGWHKCFIIVIFLLQWEEGGLDLFGHLKMNAKVVFFFFFHLLRAAFGNIALSPATASGYYISQSPKPQCLEQEWTPWLLTDHKFNNNSHSCRSLLPETNGIGNEGWAIWPWKGSWVPRFTLCLCLAKF